MFRRNLARPSAGSKRLADLENLEEETARPVSTEARPERNVRTAEAPPPAKLPRKGESFEGDVVALAAKAKTGQKEQNS